MNINLINWYNTKHILRWIKVVCDLGFLILASSIIMDAAPVEPLKVLASLAVIIVALVLLVDDTYRAIDAHIAN